jgi:hypothetical protein
MRGIGSLDALAEAVAEYVSFASRVAASTLHAAPASHTQAHASVGPGEDASPRAGQRFSRDRPARLRRLPDADTEQVPREMS